jgi:hypothetical protein
MRMAGCSLSNYCTTARHLLRQARIRSRNDTVCILADQHRLCKITQSSPVCYRIIGICANLHILGSGAWRRETGSPQTTYASIIEYMILVSENLRKEIMMTTREHILTLLPQPAGP